MFLLLSLAYLCAARVIPPQFLFLSLTALSVNSIISLSVNNSNFISVFFEQACHANPGADKK